MTPKMCPDCDQPVDEIEGKYYCFRCCSEIKKERENHDDE